MNKKEGLFRRYARNLELVASSLNLRDKKVDFGTGEEHSLQHPSYVCPLCDSLFSEVDVKSKELTLEHIPPGELGGKKRLLTCEACNNNQGSRLESYLVNKVKNSIGNTLDATLQLNEGDEPFIRGKLTDSKEQGVSFRYGKPGSVSEYFDSQVKSTQNRGKGIQFQINIRTYPRRVNLSLLRIAYLMLFEELGYGYYFSYSGKLIRSQLSSLNEGLFVPVFPLVEDSVRIKEGIYIAKTFDSKESLIGFFLSISLEVNGESRDYHIILPLPEQEYMSRYSDLVKKKNKIEFELTTLQSIDRLRDKRHIFRI